MSKRSWYVLLPVAGILFGLWYIHAASYDVVYSDYIRLVNNYLPDVWDPAKFLTPDVLTRVPVTYLGRIVNTEFFHYSLTFDQTLGVLGLGALGFVLMLYCFRQQTAAPWALLVAVLVFSLNKWELLVNGSGWVIFWAFAGFYYHYLVLDRVWSGRAKPHDRGKLLWLPSLLILGVAGQYCAVYAAVLLLMYLFRLVSVRREKKVWSKEYLGYLLAVLVPFGCYLVSNSFAVEDHAGMQDIPLLAQLAETPGYFVRFLLKSLSSAVVGADYAGSHFTGDLPYMVLGALLAGAYLWALWLQYRFRVWERTILPLILVFSGGASHLLILLSRWSFLREDYGMSSRYALQFSAGLVGILLTFAAVRRCGAAGGGNGRTGSESAAAGSVTVDDRGSGAGGRNAAMEGVAASDGGAAAAVGNGVNAAECGSAAAVGNGGPVRRTRGRGSRPAGETRPAGPGPLQTLCMAGVWLMFLTGALLDTRQELYLAPYRRELCMARAEIALDFENRTDDELRENFEYRTGQPQSGAAVRSALRILKEQGWNVFYGE